MKRSWIKRSETQMKRTAWVKKRRTEDTARKARRAYLKAGPRTKEWNNTRRQLVKEYAEKGITKCELRYEGCWNETALGFAHGRKRTRLQDGELKDLTIIACNPCHDRIEYLGPEKMLAIVQETIAKRVTDNY